MLNYAMNFHGLSAKLDSLWSSKQWLPQMNFQATLSVNTFTLYFIHVLEWWYSFSSGSQLYIMICKKALRIWSSFHLRNIKIGPNIKALLENRKIGSRTSVILAELSLWFWLFLYIYSSFSLLLVHLLASRIMDLFQHWWKCGKFFIFTGPEICCLNLVFTPKSTK